MNIELAIDRLNPKQREAVLHTEGPLLILAGAGSGKTRVITMRVAYLLHQGVPASSVLAVTFTNKAAREMRERVTSMLQGQKNRAPGISTFHSLCLNILRKEIERLGYRRDFSVYDTSEQVSLLRNILSDISFHDKTVKPEAILEMISREKNEITSANDTSSDTKDLREKVSDTLYPKYREALKTMNALDFDDLLLLTLTLFREHPEVLSRYQERFRYLMVDEYQDTNRVQYAFIRLLAGERKNLCVVGDDDQSIYGWRGANIGNILDFEKDFSGTVVIRLEQNYRSYGHILGAANGVIRNNTKRMEKSLWTDRGDGPKVSLFQATDGDDEAEWVANRIAMLQYQHKMDYKDFAVIYRANAFAKPFEEALRMKRIPYTVVGGTSYFDHREIRDLAAYLKVISNPKDDLSLLRIANVPKRGLGNTALGRLVEFSREHSLSLLDTFSRAGEISGLIPKSIEAAKELSRFIEKFRILFGKKQEMAGTFRQLIREIHYNDHVYSIYKTPEVAIRRVENVEGFADSFNRYEKGSETPSLHGFLETLALADLLKDKDEKTGGGVTLISFHSSKGLEFPVVFIVGLEEEILPHKKSMHRVEELEEERRLCYVGITRARKELYLTCCGHRIRYGKEAPAIPSRFIGEIPEELLCRIDRFEKTTPEQEEKDTRAFFANIKAMLGD